MVLERWRRARTAQPAAADEAALAGSGLFDAAFYVRCNPDVADAGLPPLTHFCQFGWREGRRPNPLFDPSWYVRTYNTGADANPLAHYLRRGEAAGARPICFFDPGRYRRWYRLPRRQSALAHHLRQRTPDNLRSNIEDRPRGFATVQDEDAALAASGLFDASLYLVEGPDIRAAGWEPLAHYRRWGWREGRRPNLYFDPAWYRARHLGDAEIDPLVHYLDVGEAAGLRPIATFDPGWYRSRYALAPGTSALAHYLANRRSQSFAPNGDFDLAFTMSEYSAALGPNRDPFAHFLIESLTRDLDPSPCFDAATYRAEVMSRELVLPATAGPAAWARVERQIPFVHFLDALP